MKIDKLDAIFSRCIKLLAGGICEFCGKLPKSVYGYHTHHFIGRRYLNTRYELDNGIAVCLGCHNFLEDFPKASWELLEKRVGSERAEQLEIIARTYRKMTKERKVIIKKDLEAKIKGLGRNQLEVTICEEFEEADAEAFQLVAKQEEIREDGKGKPK